MPVVVDGYYDDLLTSCIMKRKRKWAFILCASIVLSCEAIHLLLIGDSVDRYITLGWCDSVASTGVTRGIFAEDTIKYRGGAAAHRTGPNIGAYHCLSRATNDSIGFVHIFGSNATGPYTFRNGAEFVGPLMDTPGRIAAAMKLYYDAFHHPDRIFFNSILWDLQLLRQVHQAPIDEQQCADWFQSNVNERIDEIKKLDVALTSRSSSSPSSQSKGATIGLKTAVIDKVGLQMYGMSQFPNVSMFEKLNDIVREIAERRHLSFFDLHEDVWSTVNWNESMRGSFLANDRDPQHPNSHHSARAGDKLLSRIYSRYAVFRDQENHSTIPMKSDHTFPSPSNVSINDLHQLMSRLGSIFVTSDWHMCSIYRFGKDKRETQQSQQQHHDRKQGKIFLLTMSTLDGGTSSTVNNRLKTVSLLKQYRLHGPVSSFTLMTLWKYGCGDVLYLDEEIVKPWMSSITPFPSMLSDEFFGVNHIVRSNMTTHTHASNGITFMNPTKIVGILHTTRGKYFVYWQRTLREMSTSTALSLMNLTTLPVLVEHQISSDLMNIWPKDDAGELADVYGEHTLFQLIVSKHSKDIFVNIAGKRHLVSTLKALQRLKTIVPKTRTSGSSSTPGTMTTAVTTNEVIPLFPYQFLDILPVGEPIVE